MSQPPDDHLKALWKGQETEHPTMTTQAIRALARNHGTHVRDRFAMGLVLIAVEAAFFGVMALRARNAWILGGDVAVLAGLVWMTWRLGRKLPGRLPGASASASALIDFHRAELERQQTNYRWLLLSAGPIIAGLLVMVYGFHVLRPQAGLTRFAPFFILLVSWFVAGWFIQRRQARRLRAQIDELDAMKRD